MVVTSVLCALVVMTCYHGISAAAVPHGGKCEEPIQCNYSDGTECRNGKCECKTTLNYNGESCVESLGLGEFCEHDIQCVVSFDPKQETVWCYNKECRCKTGFKREDKRCVIGGDCTSDPDCSNLKNSSCDTRQHDRPQCACNNSYIAVANNTKCYPTVPHEIGTGCEYDEQCSQALVNTECKINKCQCVTGTTWNETEHNCNIVTPAQNAMMDAKKVGDTCMKHEQCTKNLGMYAECKMSKCICKRESQKSGDSMKCEMEKKNAAVRKFASMVCFALIVIVKMAL